jgi:Mg-chelatase subunit ChlD
MKSANVSVMLGVAVVLVAFQNCSQANFSSESASSVGKSSASATSSTSSGCETESCLVSDPTSKYADVDVRGTVVQPARSCREVLNTTTDDIRMLFVVDQSGSNDGTDPNKSYRRGSIQNFFNLYSTKSNFRWGFNSFKGSFSIAFINSGSQSRPVFGPASEMTPAISEFNRQSDSGLTDYKKALDSAASAIQNDSTRTPMTKYVVAFLSDGMPTAGYEYKVINSMGGRVLTVKGMDEMLSDVEALRQMLPGRISLNTVYYGRNNPSAALLMQKMAALGSGRFLDVNVAGNTFPIVDTVSVPSMDCQ